MRNEGADRTRGEALATEELRNAGVNRGNRAVFLRNQGASLRRGCSSSLAVQMLTSFAEVRCKLRRHSFLDQHAYVGPLFYFHSVKD